MEDNHQDGTRKSRQRLGWAMVGPGNVPGGAGKGMEKEPTVSSASYMPVLYLGVYFTISCPLQSVFHATFQTNRGSDDM